MFNVFLTEIDPDIAVKGSVDPLGFQLIWTRFGRNIIHNLTTITGSVHQFTATMLGYYFANLAVEYDSYDTNQNIRIEEEKFIPV